MSAMKSWFYGAILALAASLAWTWAKTKGVDLLVGYVMRLFTKALRGEGIEDEDLRAFEHDVALAFCRLAEAKLSEAGKGPERRAWVIAKLTTAFPWLERNRDRLDELIETAVLKLDDELKSTIAEETKASSSPAPNP